MLMRLSVIQMLASYSPIGRAQFNYSYPTCTEIVVKIGYAVLKI